MNNETEDTMLEALDGALKFSNPIIRDCLINKDVVAIKQALRTCDSSDLELLFGLAIHYEEYEVCQCIKDIFSDRH